MSSVHHSFALNASGYWKVKAKLIGQAAQEAKATLNVILNSKPFGNGIYIFKH